MIEIYYVNVVLKKFWNSKIRKDKFLEKQKQNPEQGVYPVYEFYIIILLFFTYL